MRPEQVKSRHLLPEVVAETAASYNCPVVAYTYSEPVIFMNICTTPAFRPEGKICAMLS
jgi:hypothetical protein